MSVVLLVAPAAWGKTHHGSALARHFGCKEVVEYEWMLNGCVRKLPDSCLILCDHIPSDLNPQGVRVVQGEEADAALRAVGGEPFGGRRK